MSLTTFMTQSIRALFSVEFNTLKYRYEKKFIFTSKGVILRKLLCFQQNSLRRNQMPEQHLVFTDCSGIDFFYSLLTLIQSVRPPLVLYHSLCSTCVSYGKPCSYTGFHVIPTHSLPTEADDFPRGGSILWMCFCSLTQLNLKQEVLLGRLYLCVRTNCRILCKYLLRTLSFIAQYVKNCFF